ncbi:MAG: hypothetical protein D6739_08675 [Nitrospirae bacterium]|nr:MAG: hypothetical protein D6739_08675 [Nitrospirota bacterium]
MLRTILAALLALALPSLAAADETVGARVEYWSMDLTGDIAVSGSASTTLGTDTLSLEESTDGLGLDNESPVGASAWLNLGPFFAFGRYTPIDISGRGSTTQEVAFGDVTFDVNATLDSSLQFNMYDLGVGIHLLNFDDLPVRIQVGLLGQVKLLDGNVEVTGTEAGTGATATESQDFTLPIPMVGGRLKLGLADFLAVEVRGAAIGYSGDHLYDAEARVELSPIPFVGVSGGYRIIDLAVDQSDVNLNATFDGPFVEAFIRF